MSVTLDQRDGPRKFYHHGLRLAVSDTGYSHELCLGPPVSKKKNYRLALHAAVKKTKLNISNTLQQYP